MGIKENGYNIERHKRYPKEEEFHDCFKDTFSVRNLDFIVFGHKNSPSAAKPDDHLSSRERKIVLSIIQWLGSARGQYFLQQCGYGEEESYIKKESLLSIKLSHLERQLSKIPKWIKALFT